MPRVRVKDGDREEVREILGQVLTFGRAPDNHVILTDRECSRHHCYIEKVEYGFKLVDLESRNGTKANGQFRNQHLLRTDDCISVGKSEIVFVDEEAPLPMPSPVEASPAAEPAAKDRPVPVPVSRREAAPSGPVARADSQSNAALTARRQERRERMKRMHQEQERRTLTTVFVLAGFVIVALLALFIYFLSTGSKSDDQYAQTLFSAAEQAVREAAATTDPDRKAILYEKACKQYALVPETAEAFYKTARKKMEEMSAAARDARSAALEQRVRKEMADIDRYLNSRQPPDTFGALSRYERLLQTVPADHALRAEILKRMDQVKALRDKAGSS